MNYIVFDLEFNQAWDYTENPSKLKSKCPFEIIQIGALKLDEKLKVLSSFDRLVRPVLFVDLHPFVQQITGISIENLTSAQFFREIYEEFIQFIGNESILCMWGIADMKELLRNIRYHNLDISFVPKEYINIQPYASKYLHSPKGSNVGLRSAVELLNIPLESKFHDAINDAYYTAKVFKLIYNDTIKPAIYQPDEERRNTRQNRKSRLDTDKLFKQFEKMYSRGMSGEEQSIIKLAYLMGRTNQFQTD